MTEERRGGSARRALQRGGRRPGRGGEAPEEAPGGAPAGGTAAGGHAAAGVGRRTRRSTKRITVDLPRGEHRFLRDFAYEHDTDGMRVVRALLLELRDDPDLSPRVLARTEQL